MTWRQYSDRIWLFWVERCRICGARNLSDKRRRCRGACEMAKGKGKIEKVMREFKKGELHSGSKKGPEVTSRKQAVAIAMSEARRGGKK